MDASHLQVLKSLIVTLTDEKVIICRLKFRFCIAPYQILKKCGIKGPMPVPVVGNYLVFKMVSR